MNSFYRCRICFHNGFSSQSCEKYLFDFLVELKEKIDSNEEKAIEEFLGQSIFSNEEKINQMSCSGLTLMHVNILGGKNESNENDDEDENSSNQNYLPAYDENSAVKICEILLKHGASANGNFVYEMRPLHIAIRRQWIDLTRVLLQAGANPNLPEKDIYASRPIDIAVLNDDPEMIELLHRFGVSLHGFKSMFHLVPLAEAFHRGYFRTFALLLQLGAPPSLDLDRNTFRSFGTQLFLSETPRGRANFIQLLYEHGGDIERQFRIHPMRIEADGIFRHQPEIRFSCDTICIADLPASVFIKWICQTRSLKSLCRLTLRRFCFESFPNGYQCLLSFQSDDRLTGELRHYLLFKN